MLGVKLSVREANVTPVAKTATGTKEKESLDVSSQRRHHMREAAEREIKPDKRHLSQQLVQERSWKQGRAFDLCEGAPGQTLCMTERTQWVALGSPLSCSVGSSKVKWEY